MIQHLPMEILRDKKNLQASPPTHVTLSSFRFIYSVIIFIMMLLIMMGKQARLWLQEFFILRPKISARLIFRNVDAREKLGEIRFLSQGKQEEAVLA